MSQWDYRELIGTCMSQWDYREQTIDLAQYYPLPFPDKVLLVSNAAVACKHCADLGWTQLSLLLFWFAG